MIKEFKLVKGKDLKLSKGKKKKKPNKPFKKRLGVSRAESRTIQARRSQSAPHFSRGSY